MGWHMEHDQRHPAPEPDGTRNTAPAVPERNPVPEPLRRSVLEPLSVGTRNTAPDAPPAPGTRNLVPDGRITHTGETVREWVRAALARSAAAGERFHYDASLVMLPSPNGMMSAYAIVIYTPSARLDLKPFGAVKMVGDFPDESEIVKAVRSAVEELRQMQSEALRAPVNLSSFKPQP